MAFREAGLLTLGELDDIQLILIAIFHICVSFVVVGRTCPKDCVTVDERTPSLSYLSVTCPFRSYLQLSVIQLLLRFRFDEWGLAEMARKGSLEVGEGGSGYGVEFEHECKHMD